MCSWWSIEDQSWWVGQPTPVPRAGLPSNEWGLAPILLSQATHPSPSEEGKFQNSGCAVKSPPRRGAPAQRERGGLLDKGDP